MDLQVEIERRGSRVLGRRKALGLQLANVGLRVASMPYAAAINFSNGDGLGEGDDRHMQELAHLGMERMLRGIQETTMETGTNPTLAQLAVVRSPLTMYIDNQGGAQAAEALEYAQDMASADERWFEDATA